VLVADGRPTNSMFDHLMKGSTAMVFIRKHAAQKRIEKLNELYGDFVIIDDICDIVNCSPQDFRSFQRIIEFLKKVDNLPRRIDKSFLMEYYYQIKNRKETLEKEGKSKSIIDLSLFEIYCKNKQEALYYYQKYVENKTNTFSKMTGKAKDSRSLEFHKSKYGNEAGSKLFEEKKDTGFYRKQSRRCIEYYLERGYTKSEGNEIIKEIQSVGRKDKFIERYGEKEGVRKWEDRQQKWIKSLYDDKSELEISEMHRKRNPIIAYKESGDDVETIIEKLNNHKRWHGNKLIANFDDLILKIKTDNRLYDGMHINEIPDDYYPSQFFLFDIYDNIEFLRKFVDIVNFDEQYKKRGRAYTKFVEEGYLRSSSEIYFYDLLKERDIKFSLDKKYPHETNPGSLRYDFYLEEYDMYIEISTYYDKCEQIRKVIDEKVSLFNPVVLKSKVEIKDFVESLSNDIQQVI